MADDDSDAVADLLDEALECAKKGEALPEPKKAGEKEKSKDKKKEKEREKEKGKEKEKDKKDKDRSRSKSRDRSRSRDRDRGRASRSRDRDRKDRSRDRRDRSRDRRDKDRGRRRSRSRSRSRRRRSRSRKRRSSSSRGKRKSRSRRGRDRGRDRDKDSSSRSVKPQRSAISPESMPKLAEPTMVTPIPKEPPPIPTNFRVGDWICPKCHFHNYRSKDKCPQCSTPQPLGGASVPIPGATAEDDAKRKRSKWDEMGDPSTSLPDWLKDMGKNDPKSIRPVPPGIDPSRFKIIRMEGVQIRALIGKGGETIKEIRLRSGADIKIDHLPSDPEGNVTIVGDVEKTEGMIKDTLASKGCPLGVPHAKLAAPPAPPGLGDYGPGMNAPGPGMGGHMGGPMQTPGYECADNEVIVPADLVAGLIGPSGSGVKEIRERSGGQVFISILPPSHSGADQLVRVVGDNHLLAKQLILEKIEELKFQYRGPGGCAPMPGYAAGMGMQPMGNSYPSRPKAPGVGILGAANAPPMPMSPFLQNQPRVPAPGLPPPGPPRGMAPPPALGPPMGHCGGCGPCGPPAPPPPPAGGYGPRLGGGGLGPPGGFPGGHPPEMMGPGPAIGGCGPPMGGQMSAGQGPPATPVSFAPPSASPPSGLPPTPAPPAKASTESSRDFNAMLREAARAAEATIGMSQPPKQPTPQAGVPLL